MTQREWIIQRCTQRWIGTELQYEDWPSANRPKTRTEMLEALEYCGKQWPDEEFRGHNIANCDCHKPRTDP
jgi:hypothetical protein